VNRTKVRKNIAKDGKDKQRDGGFLNITTHVAKSEVSDDSEYVGENFKEQLTRAMGSNDKAISDLNKTKMKFKQKEAEIGVIPFNMSLTRKAKQLKGIQNDQSGLVVPSTEETKNQNESDSKAKIIDLEDDYQDFNYNRDIDEIDSRRSKMKSEEQGRNIPSEPLEISTPCSLDAKNTPENHTKGTKFGSVKNIHPQDGILKDTKKHTEIEDSNDEAELMNKTFTNIENNDALDQDTSLESPIIRKGEGNTTPRSLNDHLLTPNSNPKRKWTKGSVKLNLNDSFMKNEQSVLEADTLNYEPGQNPEWKKTPLYMISHGCESADEIIGALLDIKNID
jgi:hypothetical protein